MHKNGAGCRTVDGPNESLGHIQAVVVRGDGQAPDIANLGPRRISREYEVGEWDVPITGSGRLGRRVVPVYAPVGQVLGEEVDEMALGRRRAGGARDPGDQDRCQQRP
jgi:hypothetical protein